MERGAVDYPEDVETCAPEIVFDSAGHSFSGSDVSNDPISQSANAVFVALPRPAAAINPIIHAFSHKTEAICNHCHRKCNKAFNLPCSCSYNQDFHEFDQGKEEFYGKNEEFIEKYKQTGGKVCTSCRKVGHIAKDCPHDPNTRTGINPMAELQRISMMKRGKMTLKNRAATRNYDDLKDGFSDIASLKDIIKAKRGSQDETYGRAVSLCTEEAELAALHRKK
jgi:hypothetical protein